MADILWNALYWLTSQFSTSNNAAHVKAQEEEYYATLSRDSIRASARLGNETSDNEAQKQLFLKHAVHDETVAGGTPVWRKAQFAAYIACRFGYASEHLTAVLWRSFYHESRFPFTDEVLDNDDLQYTTFEDWDHAVCCTTYLPDDPLYDAEWRRKPNWRRFETLAVRSGKQTQAVDDAWTPPDMLDKISEIVSEAVPIPRKFTRPTAEKLRPMVQEIFGECQSISTQDYALSYKQLLALLTAALQVNSGGTSIEVTPHAAHIAKALLAADAIDAGSDVSWNRYVALAERFRFIDDHNDWILDHKIRDLWTALFRVSSDEVGSAHVPFAVLHALDCLLPAPGNEPPFLYDVMRREARWSSKLIYAADAHSASSDAVMSALTGDVHPKLLMFTAEIHDEHGTSPALFVVLLSTPLWIDTKHGLEVCLAGKQHFILQIVPEARVLWCTRPEMPLRHLVKQAMNTLKLGAKKSSGLSIDYKTGVATMCSIGSSSHDTYVEIEIDPSTTATPMQSIEPWRTQAKMKKVEVYDLPCGILDELCRLQDESIEDDSEQSEES